MLPGMRPRAILGVLILGALGLRLLAIGDPLSHDEGYTWLVASAHGPGTFLDRLNAFENTPPLYYLLTWPLPNGGVAWLRLVSILAGVGCVGATYWATSEKLTPHNGVKFSFAPAFAAAALAVAPFAVSYSDYARGFLLADVGLLIALGASFRRRWLLYTAGAAIALYAEYDSALFLIAIAITMREWRAAGPIALLIPWIPAILQANAATRDTKGAAIYPNPSPGTLRDTVVRLTSGEHGTAHAASLRWLQFLLVVAVCVWAFKKAPRMLCVIGALTIGLHALVHWVGPDVFAPRYLTELIPLAAIAIGFAVAQSTRQVQVAAMVVLGVVAVGVGVRRGQGNGEPDVAAVGRVVADQTKNRTVLTNSAVVAYYLRDLHPFLDRPFGLGQGEESRCERPCKRRFLIVDDTRVANSPRSGPGAATSFGPIYVRRTP